MEYRVWGIEQSTGVRKTISVTAENMAKAEQLAALQYDLDVEGAAAISKSPSATPVPREYIRVNVAVGGSRHETLGAFSVLSIVSGILSAGVGIYILITAMNAVNGVAKSMRQHDPYSLKIDFNDVLTLGGALALVGSAPFFVFAVGLCTLGLIGLCVRDVAIQQDP